MPQIQIEGSVKFILHFSLIDLVLKDIVGRFEIKVFNTDFFPHATKS